jgi:hypothetical protein
MIETHRVSGLVLDKRQYLNGVVFYATCPDCGRTNEVDLGENYLSYPVVGEEERGYFLCSYCDEGQMYFVGQIDMTFTLTAIGSQGDLP